MLHFKALNVKQFIYYLFFIVVPQLFAQDPCFDQRYIELKNIPLDSMSQREYDYFMQKEKYCHESFSRKNSVLSFADSCELTVIVDSMSFTGEELPIKVYIDGVAYGKPPQKVRISPGLHYVDLFSEDGIERRRAFGIVNQNNKKSKLKIKCDPGANIKVSYTFMCDIGGSGTFEWDEWYFSGEVTTLKGNSP